MQMPPKQKALQKDDITQEMLKAFPRSPDDPKIIEGVSGELDLSIVIPLIKFGLIKAAFIHENEEEKALRKEFNENILTPELWQKLGEYREVFKRKSGEHIVTTPMILTPKAAPEEKAAFELIPNGYMPDIMRQQLHTLKQGDSGLRSTNSTIFVTAPNQSQEGLFPVFHIDHDYPITAHKAISGAGMEYITGLLSKAEEELRKKAPLEFNKNFPKDRIRAIKPGVTTLFGREFVHRSSSKIVQEGQLTIVSSPYTAYGS